MTATPSRSTASTTSTTARRRRIRARASTRATLGMLLFIGSEIMLFGSFFAAYFFVRVVNPSAPAEWPPEPYEFPVFVAGVNTAILVTSSFTMHWALQSIKRGEREGFPRRAWCSRS